MTILTKFLIVGAGGFFGAALRYFFYYILAAHTVKHGWPFATLAVNIIGSALIGFLAVPVEAKGHYWQLFLLVGFLGGFTTFSSFSFETLQLLNNGMLAKVFLNVILNITLCLGAVFAGFEIYKLLCR